MKIKNGFILRNVSDAYVVVAVGEAAKDFNGMITLNETGAFYGKRWQTDVPIRTSLSQSY